MKEKEKFEKCPDFEVLSAFSDSEIDKESVEYQHIQACPICQKRLDGLKKLNFAISSSLIDVIQGKDIEEKVIKALNYEKKRESFNIENYLQFFLRIAAVFAIFALVIFYFSKLLIKKEENFSSITSKVSSENETKKDSTQTKQKNIQISSKIHDTSITSPLNGFNINDVKSTGTGTEMDFHKVLFDDNKTGSAFIKPVVKHNWIWNEENKQMPIVKQIIEKYGEIQNISENTFYINITKENLVKLVRKIKNFGFKLLSDEEPMPETTIFAGNPDEVVQYCATFICKQ
ncbi:MAG TPA: hypothetical protein PLN24_02905 [Victivallales bacterium]|nr:hypothetical protein [Victivallales bacterium]HPO90502.1 hypothetical protein [Victivallales bacterium]HRU01164.1 hypothetical protein [Victivallales bacterium]